MCRVRLRFGVMLSRSALATVLVSVLLSAGGAAFVQPARTAEPDLPRPALPPATRGPVRVVFSPDGTTALVAEADAATVAVVDRPSGAVRRRIPTGGERPTGLAWAGDGLAVVTNSFSGTVALLDTRTGQRRALLALRGEPWDVVVPEGGSRAFVSLAQLGEVAVLELPGLKVVRRIPVGQRPRPLALVPGQPLLLAANFQGGDVSLVDTAALTEQRRIHLPGVNLRGVAVSADGQSAYVTGQIPANSRPTHEPLDLWTNTIFRLDLRPGKVPNSSEGWIDFTGSASPDPDGIAILGQERVAVSLSGSDQALLVRTPGPHLRTYDPVIEQRVAVGARPRGLAVTPDEREVWVANELSSTLSVLDAATLRPLRQVELGIPPKRDLRLEGRYLFGNAALTKGHQFTCNSCHPEGNTDGLDWEFVHVPDGLPRRNTRNLRGGVTFTAPFRWTGHDREIEEFFQEEIVGLLQGPRQEHPALHALWNMLDQFPMPPNPFREADGSHTAAGKRGQVLFEGKAGCASCHSGEMRGGTGEKAWVGSTPESLPLDVPHLAGAYDSYPYLHDGRARTLEEVFSGFNTRRKHGNAHQLSPGELADLLRYVREL